MNNLLTKVPTDLPLSLMLRLIPAFIGAGTDAMGVPRIHGWLLVALFALLASCAAPPIAFQNNSHRQNYSLNLQDLEKLQFFISTDVVAQYQDATGTKSLLLPRMTPGVATGAGPNWIKVSFREGGADIPFIADPNEYDGRYWIASEVEGTKDFKKIVGSSREIFCLQRSSVQNGLRKRSDFARGLGRLEESCRDTQSYRGTTAGRELIVGERLQCRRENAIFPFTARVARRKPRNPPVDIAQEIVKDCEGASNSAMES